MIWKGLQRGENVSVLSCFLFVMYYRSSRLVPKEVGVGLC